MSRSKIICFPYFSLLADRTVNKLVHHLHILFWFHSTFCLPDRISQMNLSIKILRRSMIALHQGTLSGYPCMSHLEVKAVGHSQRLQEKILLVQNTTQCLFFMKLKCKEKYPQHKNLTFTSGLFPTPYPICFTSSDRRTKQIKALVTRERKFIGVCSLIPNNGSILQRGRMATILS